MKGPVQLGESMSWSRLFRRPTAGAIGSIGTVCFIAIGRLRAGCPDCPRMASVACRGCLADSGFPSLHTYA